MRAGRFPLGGGESFHKPARPLVARVGDRPWLRYPDELGRLGFPRIARARSAPQLFRPLGAALPRGLPLRDHLLLEPSAPARLSSGAKGGARPRSFPRCNSVALPRNWNPGFTQADSARSSHPAESLARGCLHSGWARGRGWGMLGPFLKPGSMNSR